MRLAHIFGSLAVIGEMPLHFLKVLDFDQQDNQMSKA